MAINLYFSTKKDVKIKYIIYTENTENFERTIKSDYNTEHQMQIIGLVPNVENEITIISTDKNQVSKEYKFKIKVPNIKAEKIDINKKAISDNNEIDDGLYVILGGINNNKMENVYLIDNYGTIRGEMPIINSDSTQGYNTSVGNIIFSNDDYMYYNYAENQIVKIDKLGQIKDIYEWDNKYKKHHDFAIDKANNKILVLVSDSESKTEEYLQ